MFFLTLASPKTSAGATCQHCMFQNSILSAVSSRRDWIPAATIRLWLVFLLF